jgi:hypothetical protein
VRKSLNEASSGPKTAGFVNFNSSALLHEEAEGTAFRPLAMQQRMHLVDRIRDEQAESIGDVPSTTAALGVPEEDKHWNAMFGADEEKRSESASDEDGSDSDSVDSDHLFDEALLVADRERERKWAERVLLLHEQRLICQGIT